LIGLWESGTQTGSIAWASFIAKNNDLAAAIEEAQQYVRSAR